MGIFSNILNIGKGLFGRLLGGAGSIGSKIGNVVSTVGTSLINKVPAIGTALNSIGINPTAIGQGISNIATNLTNQNLGGVASGVLDGINGIGNVVGNVKRIFQRD